MSNENNLHGVAPEVYDETFSEDTTVVQTSGVKTWDVAALQTKIRAQDQAYAVYYTL